MKFSTAIVSALAAVATAAPTKVEERAAFDLGLLNNLGGFKNLDLNYLLNINSLNLQAFGNLGVQNNFNVLGFQNLFNSGVFDINSLLALQQIQTLLAIQNTGLLNGFDLAGLNLGGLNLGLINNIGGINLGQFIDQSFIPQITQIAQQTVTFIKE